MEGRASRIASMLDGDDLPNHISPIDFASVPNEQFAHLIVHPRFSRSEDTALASVDLPIPGNPLIIVDLPSLTTSIIP